MTVRELRELLESFEEQTPEAQDAEVYYQDTWNGGSSKINRIVGTLEKEPEDEDWKAKGLMLQS